jgi:hypothetical protein
LSRNTESLDRIAIASIGISGRDMFSIIDWYKVVVGLGNIESLMHLQLVFVGAWNDIDTDIDAWFVCITSTKTHDKICKTQRYKQRNEIQI